MPWQETSKRWNNRSEAGHELAQKLIAVDGAWPPSTTTVVALPRGGVAVAVEVAKLLRVPLTTWSVRKIARAQAPEVAVGAIAAGGIEEWENESMAIPRQERHQHLEREYQELKRRQQCFGDGPLNNLRDKNLIVIDDGIATGMTMLAALRSLQAASPSHLVVAVPVVDCHLVARLREHCDRLIALQAVQNLHAVGAYYENFEQLNDEEVLALLNQAKQFMVPKY